MYVHDWKDAEGNAALYLRALGYDDAQTTAGGADGGIDVRATGALAQVKHENRPIGAPIVQNLVGARALEINADLFFFSLNGFTAQAVTYGDMMEVALFTYDLSGGFQPANRAAASVLKRAASSGGRSRPPRSAPDPQTVLDAWVLRDESHPSYGSQAKLYWGHWLRAVSVIAFGYAIWDGVKHGSPWPVHDAYTFLSALLGIWLGDSVVKRKRRRRARHDAIADLDDQFGLSARTPEHCKVLRDAVASVVERTPGILSALRTETQFDVMRRLQTVYPGLSAGEALGLLREVFGGEDASTSGIGLSATSDKPSSAFRRGRESYDRLHSAPQPPRQEATQGRQPTFDEWAARHRTPDQAEQLDLEFDYWQLVISRDEIESEDIATALAFLKSGLESPEEAMARRERMAIAIHGYDDDPRELWEVPEVRAYLQGLDDQFPYWIWFMDKTVGSLQVIMLAHVEVDRVAPGKLRYDRQEMDALLERRWIPESRWVATFAGCDEKEIDDMGKRAEVYAAQGPAAFL